MSTKTRSSITSTVVVWAGLHSMLSNSTISPTGTAVVAGTHTWLVSGRGVGLAMSFWPGQMVKGDLLYTSTHSTNATISSRGPSTGRRALKRSLRLVWVASLYGYGPPVDGPPVEVHRRQVHITHTHTHKEEKEKAAKITSVKVQSSVMGVCIYEVHDKNN